MIIKPETDHDYIIINKHLLHHDADVGKYLSCNRVGNSKRVYIMYNILYKSSLPSYQQFIGILK